MQHPRIVEDEQFTRRELECDRHCRILYAFGETPAGFVVARHVVERNIGYGGERSVVESHGNEFAIRAQLDERSLGPQPHAGEAGIFEARRIGRKKPEICGFLRSQNFNDLETIDDERLPAVHGVFETGEKLQGRNRIAVRIISMGLKTEIGIGKIARIHLGSDLEPAAVVGFAYIAEAFSDLAQETVFRRDVGQKRKTVAAHRGKPGAERGAVARDDAPAGGWDLRLERTVPAVDDRIGPGGSTPMRVIIAVRLQPRQREAYRFFFRPEFDLEAATIDHGGGETDIRRLIENGDEALPVAGTSGVGIGRIVAKPIGVKPRAAAIRPEQLQSGSILEDAGSGHGTPLKWPANPG